MVKNKDIIFRLSGILSLFFLTVLFSSCGLIGDLVRSGGQTPTATANSNADTNTNSNESSEMPLDENSDQILQENSSKEQEETTSSEASSSISSEHPEDNGDIDSAAQASEAEDEEIAGSGCPIPQITLDIVNGEIPVRVGNEVEFIIHTDVEIDDIIWIINGELHESNSSSIKYTVPNISKISIEVVGTNECGTQGSIGKDFEVVAPISAPMPPKPFIIPESLQIEPGGAFTVCWNWGGVLGADNNFAIRFWNKNSTQPEARFSITWTKEKCYKFQVENDKYPQGDYYLNVAVMEGQSDGVHSVVVESDPILINVPAIQPTLPPPP